MNFKGMAKGGGLFLVSMIVVLVSWLMQVTEGFLKIGVMIGGLVTVFLLFSFLLSRADDPAQ